MAQVFLQFCYIDLKRKFGKLTLGLFRLDIGTTELYIDCAIKMNIFSSHKWQPPIPLTLENTTAVEV